MTEIIDDVVFARTPIDAEGAKDLIGCLRTLRRLPELVSPRQRVLAAEFLTEFSACAATAPWPRFSFEVNPLKLAADAVMAVDGLIVLE